MSTLFIVRGLPGSGKSTLASKLGKVVSADDFFTIDGLYTFNVADLPNAHAWCLVAARNALKWGDVAVANTFSQRWEMEPYLLLAAKLASRVFVLDLFDGGCTDEDLFARNVHGVPLATIQVMRARWEHDWRNGNPERPPYKGG